MPITSVLFRHAGARRIANNDCIALWRDEAAKQPKVQRLRKNQLRPACNRVKYDLHPWFAEVSQNAVKGGYIGAEDAIARYYKGQHRRPRLHSKYTRPPAFRADNGVGIVKLDQHRRPVLPKLMGGAYRIRGLRRRGIIRQCHIFYKAGDWYASLLMAVPGDSIKDRAGVGPTGLDLGLKAFATVAWPSGDVEKVNGLEPLKAALTRLRRAQWRVSRRKKGSANRRKVGLTGYEAVRVYTEQAERRHSDKQPRQDENPVKEQ